MTQDEVRKIIIPALSLSDKEELGLKNKKEICWIYSRTQIPPRLFPSFQAGYYLKDENGFIIEKLGVEEVYPSSLLRIIHSAIKGTKIEILGLPSTGLSSINFDYYNLGPSVSYSLNSDDTSLNSSISDCVISFFNQKKN